MILGLLFLAPALLLAVLLLTRRYPGERVLVALRRRRRVTWTRAASLRVRRTLLVLSRPGRLVAGRQEIRGPPFGIAVPIPF